MKKNRMMRLASILLVCVLLTTSVISGTFAKYITSDSAQDSARVAHWGVEVEVTGEEAFKTQYEGTAGGANDTDKLTVKSSTEKKLMAPGTGGTLATIAVTGSPEVDALVKVSATVGISDWLIDADNDGLTDNYYCPLVVTVGSAVLCGNEYQSAVQFAGAIKSALQAYTSYYNAGVDTNLNKSVNVSWAWNYEEIAVGQTHELDTILGDRANVEGDAADFLSLDLTVTVEQVD